MENQSSTPDLKQAIVKALESCYDPEIPVNIYELGLIYDIALEDGNKANVKMTLTSPACPAAASLPAEVESKIKTIPGITAANVEVVWEPPRNHGMMSLFAKFELGFM